MSDLELLILRCALKNALEHEGKAIVKAVLGRVIAANPDLRLRLEEVKAKVEEIVLEVNSLSLEQQRKKLEEVGEPEVEKRERVGLPDLPRKDRVVTRFAPNPNGPLHLGHVRAALLSHEYARRYNGKFILRFEDTNPENSLLEMYEQIKRDLEWLGIRWDEEYCQSDRLEIYYRYAEKLLAEGKAYVCTCKPENFRQLRDSRIPCPCRSLSSSESLERWEKMLKGKFGEGEAVVRIKTDISHPNPAVRDWPALRIVETPHPRTGTSFRVWPLYNFSVSIDDHEMGITHIFRGKEHEVNEEIQRYLYNHLGWEYPIAVQYGRLMLEGVELSKTKIMEGIRNGYYTGIDDIRLATIASLRRRGYLPQAIKETLLEVGLTLVDSHLSWKTLAAHNRKLIDPLANRYFFVPDPVEIEILGVPRVEEVKVRLHPSYPERGERKIPIDWSEGVVKVKISKQDLKTIKEQEIFRLMGFMNVKREDGRFLFHGFEVLPVRKIQWVSKSPLEARVLKPEGEERGFVESSILSEKNQVVQLERYGFVRIESLEPPIFVYAHD